MTDELLQGLQSFPPWMIHGFLIGSTVMENLFPPWPGDTVVVFAGMLSTQGVIGFWTAVLSTLLGNLLGCWIMYFAGERLVLFVRSVHGNLQDGLLKKTLEDLVSHSRLERTSDWFRRWGAWFVLFSRFSAGVRFFVSIIAGIARMNLLLFSVAFGAGSIMWNLLLLSGGRVLAANWKRVLHWLQIYDIAAGVLVTVVVGLIVWKIYKRRANKNERRP